MAFKKNWEYTQLFNYHLLIMKEKGVMDKLLRPYLLTTKKSCPNQQLIRRVLNKPMPVGVNTIVSGHLIVIIGCIIALAILIIEAIDKHINMIHS